MASINYHVFYLDADLYAKLSDLPLNRHCLMLARYLIPGRDCVKTQGVFVNSTNFNGALVYCTTNPSSKPRLRKKALMGEVIV